jgi:hypothetical protein
MSYDAKTSHYQSQKICLLKQEFVLVVVVVAVVLLQYGFWFNTNVQTDMPVTIIPIVRNVIALT